MSERSYAVRLSARVDQYVAAMKQAESATSQFSTQSQRNLQKLGGQMQNVGGDMTRKVTVPLVGLGVAAVKMGSDFDAVFAQMVGLADVPADEVDRLKESVLDLAGETARSPRELAEALYFAASAGLNSAGAMKAVEVAARAASVGLGSTQDIVGLAASAIAAYGAENITAAEATDILVATIREGRAEPAELAGTLGRVLPIASQLGVSLGEVGGTVAYLSNVFGDTNRTVTATQGLLVKLVAPSQQGRDALREMGTSVEELHQAVDQRGLLGALDLLRERGFAGNSQALRALFDDIEGYQAALALLNADQAQLVGTMDATTNSAGSLQQAWEAIDPEVQQLKQSWVDLQVAMIEAGKILAPIAADIMGMVAGIASGFADLPGPAQKVVLVLLAVAAAAGPVIWAAGTVVKNLGYMTTAFGKVRGASTLMKGSMVGVAAALTAAAIIYDSYNRKKQLAKQRTDDLTAALEAERNGQEGATDSLLSSTYATDEYRDTLGRLGISIADVVRHIQGENVPAVAALVEKYDEASGVAKTTKAGIEELTGVTGLNTSAFRRLMEAVELDTKAMEEGRRVDAAKAGAQEELARATDTSAYAANAAAYEQELLARATEAAGNATDDKTLSDEELAEAEALLEAQIERTAAAQETNANRTDRAREAHERYVESILNSLSGLFNHEQSVLRTENAYMDYTEAVLKNVEAQADSELSDREKAESANNLRLQELALAESAYGTAEAYAAESGAVEGTKGWVDRMIESLSAQAEQYPELREEIDAYIEKLGQIPTTIHTGVTITYTSPTGTRVTVAAGPSGGTTGTSGKRAAGGPTRAGHTYEVLEGGKSELLTEGGRTFLMSAQDGHVTPLSAMPTTTTATPGLSTKELADAISAAMPMLPETLVLEVDGRQMTAHIRGVLGGVEREKAGML